MIFKKMAAVGLLFGLAVSANATPVTFDLAGAPDSYVNITSGFCLPLCGATADLNSHLDSLSHTLSAGDTWSFNLFSLDIFGIGIGGGTVEAFLAFDQPLGSPGAGGFGVGGFATWDITAGALVWLTQPGSFLLGDGTAYNVTFDNLLGHTRHQDIIVRANLTLLREPNGNVSVPEPGPLALLGLGLLAFGLFSRRRYGNRGNRA